MGKKYNKAPSDILKIEDDLLAYMIDEFAMTLEYNLTDKKGNVNWLKVLDKKSSTKTKTNKDFMEFINKNKKPANVVRK